MHDLWVLRYENNFLYTGTAFIRGRDLYINLNFPIMSSENTHSSGSRLLNVFSYFSSCIASIQQLKKELNLKQPGAFDSLGREAKSMSGVFCAI